MTGGHDRTVRLWNPLRLDPAFSTDDNAQTSQQIPRGLPIQTYSSNFTHSISALDTATSNENTEWLLTAHDKTLVLTDLVTTQVLRTLSGYHSARINACQFSHPIMRDVCVSASYDRSVALWDLRAKHSHRPIQVLDQAKDSVTDILVSTTNESAPILRSCSVDGCIRSYDIRRGILKCDDCSVPLTSMALDKQEQCLVVGGLDGTVRLVECESGELVNTYHGSHTSGSFGLHVAVLANDATIATGSEDGSCVLYDYVQANCVQKLSSTVSTTSSEQAPTCAIAAHPKQSSVLITTNFKEEAAVVWAHDPGICSST